MQLWLTGCRKETRSLMKAAMMEDVVTNSFFNYQWFAGLGFCQRITQYGWTAWTSLSVICRKKDEGVGTDMRENCYKTVTFCGHVYVGVISGVSGEQQEWGGKQEIYKLSLQQQQQQQRRGVVDLLRSHEPHIQGISSSQMWPVAITFSRFK